MRRRYNTSLIKKHRTYNTKDVAALFGMHIESVQRWVANEGLLPIEGGSGPYLIYGQDLVDFLGKKNRKHKHSLQPDEFYCMACHCPRRSTPADMTITKTETQMGKHNQYMGVRSGKCEVCGTKIYRFFTYEREAAEKVS